MKWWRKQLKQRLAGKEAGNVHRSLCSTLVTLRQANSWVQAGKCSSGAAFLHRQRWVHQHGLAMALPLSSSEHWQTPPFVLRISSHYLRYTHIEIFSNLHILLPPVMRNYIFFTAEQSKCVWPQAFPKMSIRSNVLISQLCKPFFYQLLIRNLKNLTPILDVKKSKYIQVNNGLFHIILQVSTRGHHRGLPSTT